MSFHVFLSHIYYVYKIVNMVSYYSLQQFFGNSSTSHICPLYSPFIVSSKQFLAVLRLSIIHNSLSDRSPSVLVCQEEAYPCFSLIVYKIFQLNFQLFDLLERLEILKIESSVEKGYERINELEHDQLCGHVSVMLLLGPEVNKLIKWTKKM